MITKPDYAALLARALVETDRLRAKLAATEAALAAEVERRIAAEERAHDVDDRLFGYALEAERLRKEIAQLKRGGTQ